MRKFRGCKIDMSKADKETKTKALDELKRLGYKPLVDRPVGAKTTMFFMYPDGELTSGRRDKEYFDRHDHKEITIADILGTKKRLVVHLQQEGCKVSGYVKYMDEKLRGKGTLVKNKDNKKICKIVSRSVYNRKKAICNPTIEEDVLFLRGVIDGNPNIKQDYDIFSHTFKSSYDAAQAIDEINALVEAINEPDWVLGQDLAVKEEKKSVLWCEHCGAAIILR